jgi:hypothetical protein
MTAKSQTIVWAIRVGITVVLFFVVRWTRALLDYVLQFFDLPDWAVIAVRILFFIGLILLLTPVLRWLIQYFKEKGIMLDKFDA